VGVAVGWFVALDVAVGSTVFSGIPDACSPLGKKAKQPTNITITSAMETVAFALLPK